MDEEINKIKSVSISQVLESEELTRLVLKLYVYLFDCKNPKFCTRSITQYFSEIRVKGFENLKLKTMERKYILKDDVVIWDCLTLKHYNSLTITDEIAANLLKVSPRLASQFESIPTIIEPEKKEIQAKEIKQPKQKNKK